jgi:hypothetical protein
VLVFDKNMALATKATRGAVGTNNWTRKLEEKKAQERLLFILETQ